MELKKDKWTKKDIKELNDYLKALGNPSKVEWTKNIAQTSLPVLAIKSDDLKKVIKEISKGNFMSLLDLMVWDYFENAAINGSLICKIKDFDTIKKYLDIYSKKADNWSTCDTLSFNVKGNEETFFNISLEYSKSDKPFVRRIGMRILFSFINNDDYIEKIFKLLDSFKEEEHYYVNMINAWLLCECMVRQREKTLKYLEHHNLNKFTINKGIQKCRDSYRISKEDKELLLRYKIK